MTQRSWENLADEISFGTRQRELIQLFIDFDPIIGKTLAEICQGAIQIVSNKGIKDRFAPAAHNFRELLWVFKREKFGLSGRFEVKKEDVKKILQRLDPLGGPPDEVIHTVAKEFEDLYGYFSAIAHHLKKADPDTFSKKLYDLEEIFFVLLKPFFKVLGEIEILIKKPKTKTNIQEIIKRAKNKALSNYIFEKAGEDLLEPLVREGFFKNPSKPIRNENGSISFPIWPQSRYLARIADKKPKRVLEIIKNCEFSIDSKELNPYILGDFVDAALKISPKYSKEIVELVEKRKWLQCPYSFLLPRKLGDLMEYLANHDELDSALKLADLLFDVKIDKPIKLKGKKGPISVIHQDAKPLYDEWQLEQIIKNKTQKLKERALEEFISILCKRLAKALFLEQKQRESNESKKDYNDLSYIWRPNIAYARRYTNDVKDIFVTTIIEMLKELGKKKPQKLSSAMKILTRHQFLVFKRLGLYIYHLFPKHFKKEIKEVLLNEDIIRAYGLQKEYSLLLKECFSNQGKETQAGILKLIGKGPKVKKYQREEIEKYKNCWRLKYLHLIKGFLPNEWQKKYNQYIAEFGEPQYDEWEMKTWTGPTSPLSKEELKEKLNKEGVQGMINYLITWPPPKDFFGVPSPEGLGRLVSEVIKEQPEEFSNSAILFYNKRIRPVYIYHLFWGLQQALKDKKCFNWNPVIDLALKIIQSKELKIFENPSEKLEPDWDSVKKSIVDLYGDGFGSSCQIPFARRVDIWKAIENISEHKEPDLEYEKKYGGDNMDPATLSINTVRGEAIHTVIKYALWCANNLYPKGERKKQPPNKLVPEVKKVLEKHLDPKVDPSTTIRAVYGWYLPSLFYLNKQWVLENKNKIFPKEPNLEHLWLAVFETYLAANNIYKEIFDVLKEDYKRAINYIKKDISKRRHFADIREKLPPHLMIAYAYGFANKGLINKFLKEEVPAPIRGDAIRFVGSNLLNKALKQVPKQKIGINLEKLEQLWNKIIQKEKQDVEEFKEFGWWFVNNPFDKKWAIDSLLKTLQITNGEIEPTHQVMDELSNYAKDFPLSTIKSLDLIVKGDKRGWEIYFKREECKKIIQTVKQSKDRKAKKEVDRLINYLGERGYLEFKELLQMG